MTVEALRALDARALEAVMRERAEAGMSAIDGLAGFMWHGTALAMPAPLFRLLGKFGKAFVADAASGLVSGWNVRMQQTADDRWDPKLLRGREIIYGRYQLVGPRADAPYPGALLIDYGLGKNKAWDPLRTVRDFVVELEPGLWLGHMYLQVAGRLVATPSWFALARGEALS